MKQTVAIILPAYNEEQTIEDCIRGFHKEIPEAQIVVIDNNSQDETAKIALRTFQSLKKCKGTLLRESRQGKAYAVRTAFQRVNADIYVMVDADTTYQPKDLRLLMEPVILDEADMVVGDRRKSGAYERENKRSLHNFGNQLVKTIINFLFSSRLNDIMSGYRVFNRKFVEMYPILSAGFEIETEMTLHAVDKRFRILEREIEYKDRPQGSESKLNTLKDGFKVLGTIVWIFKYYKPFLFFGSIAGLFLACGFISGIPVLVEFYYTQYIKHVPLAILSTGFMILSILSFSVGVILDTTVKFHKFDFEMKLNQFDKRK